jgi:hypothetical protein
MISPDALDVQKNWGHFYSSSPKTAAVIRFSFPSMPPDERIFPPVFRRGRR